MWKFLPFWVSARDFAIDKEFPERSVKRGGTQSALGRALLNFIITEVKRVRVRPP